MIKEQGSWKGKWSSWTWLWWIKLKTYESKSKGGPSLLRPIRFRVRQLHFKEYFVIGKSSRVMRVLLLGYCAFQLHGILNFAGRPTNAFLAASNQMFGGSSQLTTSAEHCFVVWTVHSDFITTRSAGVGSWEEPPNTDLIDGSEKRIGRLSFEC